MGKRIIISSDHVDRHNEVMTKQALESGAKIINGDKCVKWTVEHKKDIPPLGKIDDAEVIEKDGHYYLTAQEVEYDNYEEISWDENLIKASCSTNNKPFNETTQGAPQQLTIQLDPHIFKSFDDYYKYQEKLEEIIPKLNSEEYGRKALINDPEIVIRLTEYYFLYKILNPILEKTAEKISEKISEKLSDESVKFYDFIRKTIVELTSRLKPTKRPISYVIQIPGTPEIELFARIKSAEELVKALKKQKVEKIKDEMNRLSQNFDIEKAQFILEQGKWRFNFLLTAKGEAIGTKKSFKKRDRKLEYVTEKIKEKTKHNNRSMSGRHDPAITPG